jgi:hypothetical protein
MVSVFGFSHGKHVSKTVSALAAPRLNLAGLGVQPLDGRRRSALLALLAAAALLAACS